MAPAKLCLFYGIDVLLAMFLQDAHHGVLVSLFCLLNKLARSFWSRLLANRLTALVSEQLV
ncbi:hypothetical protein AAHH84_00085 [Candidatus Hodgkinia cicadicola]